MKPKARLWKKGTTNAPYDLWICISDDYWRGYGSTPIAAYRDLIFVKDAARAAGFIR